MRPAEKRHPGVTTTFCRSNWQLLHPPSTDRFFEIGSSSVAIRYPRFAHLHFQPSDSDWAAALRQFRCRLDGQARNNHVRGRLAESPQSPIWLPGHNLRRQPRRMRHVFEHTTTPSSPRSSPAQFKPTHWFGQQSVVLQLLTTLKMDMTISTKMTTTAAAARPVFGV